MSTPRLHSTSPGRRQCTAHRCALALGALLCVVVSGCVIERTPGDEDANEPPSTAPPEVPPFGSPVQVVATWPAHGDEEIAVDTPVWIELDRYIDPDLIARRSTIRMQSGGRFASVDVQWEMVDRRLVGKLASPLLSDVQYTFTLDPGRIVGMDGSPMLEAPTIAFRTTARVDGAVAVAAEPSFDADIAPILERACGCHRMAEYPDPWFDIAALTWDRMVGQFGRTDDLYYLVDPYRPAYSTLLRKALPDFPVRHGAAMPPAWGVDESRTAELPQRPLTADELRLIEDWILIGAPR